jgi:cruciform cutting endonuclease 1
MRLDQQLLKSLKVAQLKELLVAIGAKTAGSKDELIKRLESDLYRPKIANLAQYRRPHPSRILSIDMGIKNLGLCVSDVDFAKSDAANGSITAKLRVSRWKRLTLLDPDEPNADDADDGGGSFSPAALSTVACRLVRDELLPLRPSVVLMERQRWRSGGAAAVTEWTVRVNVLEAMLWAVFRAAGPRTAGAGAGGRDGGGAVAKEQPLRQPELHAVSPARVAAFWLPGLRRVEKKAKVDLVRACIARGGLGGVEVAFGDDAAEVARGFGAVGRAKRNADGSTSPRRKLDDLADSLLQASAWAAWEANRRSLLDKGIEMYLTDCRNNREPSHVRKDDLKVV